MNKLPDSVTEEQWNKMDKSQKEIWKLLVYLEKKNADISRNAFKKEEVGDKIHFLARAEMCCDLAAMVKENTIRELLDILDIA